MKALGFNSLKVQCFQDIGFKDSNIKLHPLQRGSPVKAGMNQANRYAGKMLKSEIAQAREGCGGWGCTS